jgi:predicted AlkP superfamily pyrophosphatase or phosphodiesterase
MMRKISAGLVSAVAALAFVAAAPMPAAAPDRTVVVVLFDGFSPAELDAAKGRTPNFDRLKREGAYSRHLVPAFPTISLINHTTFETGCWPEHHGIMSNAFYDTKMKRAFGEGMDVGDADWHTGCEAMWQAAERQGVPTAIFNWVGRQSRSKGMLTRFGNKMVPWKQRETDDKILAEAIHEIKDNGPNHPRLIGLYFNQPDDTAHFNGVAAPKTQEAVHYVDGITGKLLAALSSLPKGREATLVIGTDHGMMDVGPLINVGRLMNMFDIHGIQATDGATAFLYLDKGESANRVVAALNGSGHSDAFRAYKKGHYPAYAHLGNGPRVPDVMIIANPPFWIVGPEVFPWWANALGVNHFWSPVFTPFAGGLKATHGYDPAIVQMHGNFFMWGSGVKPGAIPRLDMIDIHPTVMKLLGLQPGVPVDGKPVTSALAP